MNQKFNPNDIMKNIRNSIIKVTEGNRYGTGSFVQKDYCVTCHHVICEMDEITVQQGNNTFDVSYSREYSDPIKDIAVLKVLNTNIEPLVCSKQALPQLNVWGYGYLQELISNLPRGFQFSGQLQFGGDETIFDEVAIVKNDIRP